MSAHFELFADCQSVAEWITPHDDRLIKLTGKQPPVDAGNLREEWVLEPSEVGSLLIAIKSLLVPATVNSRVNPRYDVSDRSMPGTGTLALEFDNPEDAAMCLPVNGETLVFNRNETIAHAAIARCSKVAALAVICMADSVDGEIVDFAVQPIRQDISLALLR